MKGKYFANVPAFYCSTFLKIKHSLYYLVTTCKLEDMEETERDESLWPGGDIVSDGGVTLGCRTPCRERDRRPAGHTVKLCVASGFSAGGWNMWSLHYVRLL